MKGVNNQVANEKAIHSQSQKQLEKYPKQTHINIIAIDINKEIHLDNYYSKDFLKQYFK